MCGIAGIFSKENITNKDVNQVRRMNEIQKHRGPDDEGVFSDTHCVLGHQRLSIIDLSRDGRQPFVSEDGRYQLVFNGEIYNYIELKEELEAKGITFRTKTDTEVLLKTYQEYKESCLSKFNGMFAFIIYDTKECTLFFARDRIGIKPLYYAQMDSKLYFSSEIKALREVLKNKLTIRHQSIFDYVVFNRTDIFDETFFNEIKRIPKGHFAHFSGNDLKLVQWWDPSEYAHNKSTASLEELIKDVDKTFVSAVKLRMRSDVPVGSCLSGGLDSTIITGILYQHNQVSEGYPTFTSSFPNHPVDETKYIDQLNQKYPFKNHRTFPTAETSFDSLCDFMLAVDEPTTDSSFYSQYEVMRLAKKNNITVLLDGQGGDENFAGYQYFYGFYLYGLLKRLNMPKFFGELTHTILRNPKEYAFETLIFQVLPKRVRKSLLYSRCPYLNQEFFDAHIESSRIFNEFFNVKDLNESLLRHFQYKLEHLLRIEDRTSMAFSLEARVPYLDHRLVEKVLSVSDEFKIKNGETKYLQKQALGRYTTDEICNRKDKIGFGTPMDEWMSNGKWQDLTISNYSELKKTWPGIFKKKSFAPDKGQERWKINQLSTWKNMINN